MESPKNHEDPRRQWATNKNESGDKNEKAMQEQTKSKSICENYPKRLPYKERPVVQKNDRSLTRPAMARSSRTQLSTLLANRIVVRKPKKN